MTIKGSRRSALILATGMLVCFAGPSQAAAGNTPSGDAKDISTPTTDVLQTAAENPTGTQPVAETQVIPADQLNEVDRALQESKPPAATFAMASVDAPAVTSNESYGWDHASLIGKIFIGFGTLLTVASAARMLMA